jgi:hypothetical protein
MRARDGLYGDSVHPIRLGAYGYTLSGLPEAGILVRDPPARWPELRVEQGRMAGDPGTTEVGPESARIRLVDGGRLELDRQQRVARFLTRMPLEPDELAHPYLAAAASTFAGWLGRDAFHAGAFALDGGALALLASKHGGKSTTLAALAQRGGSILTDDVLVVEGDAAFAGPRCIDLREDAVLAAAGVLEARGGTRRRLHLPHLDPELPLRGFVRLVWGERCELVPLRAAERLVLVARSRWDPRAAGPARPLALAELPAWELRRPRTLDVLGEVCDLLFSLSGSV